MNQKVKINLFLGPKDGLVMYWDDVDDEFIYYSYEAQERVPSPDLTNFEYHVYQLDLKNGNEFRYSYIGVSALEPQ
jgi:hypothetical protein